MQQQNNAGTKECYQVSLYYTFFSMPIEKMGLFFLRQPVTCWSYAVPFKRKHLAFKRLALG